MSNGDRKITLMTYRIYRWSPERLPLVDIVFTRPQKSKDDHTDRSAQVPLVSEAVGMIGRADRQRVRALDQ